MISGTLTIIRRERDRGVIENEGESVNIGSWIINKINKAILIYLFGRNQSNNKMKKQEG